jgi:predicted RNase H-like nuclease (RuvC/YqgF family)
MTLSFIYSLLIIGAFSQVCCSWKPKSDYQSSDYQESTQLETTNNVLIKQSLNELSYTSNKCVDQETVETVSNANAKIFDLNKQRLQLEVEVKLQQQYKLIIEEKINEIKNLKNDITNLDSKLTALKKENSNLKSVYDKL